LLFFVVMLIYCNVFEKDGDLFFLLNIFLLNVFVLISGILWVTIGADCSWKPTDLQAVVLAFLLHREKEEVKNVQEGKIRLSLSAKDAFCLFILDDVWDKEYISCLDRLVDLSLSVHHNIFLLPKIYSFVPVHKILQQIHHQRKKKLPPLP